MSQKIVLFAFPFAGGSRYSYQNLCAACSTKIEFLPVEYSGHGLRVNEPLMTDIDCIVEDLFEQIKDRLEQPYAFFGHSMGCTVAYLLTKKIIKAKKRLPLHLFLSGRGGPSGESLSSRYLLSDKEFLKVLIALGGVPHEIVKNEAALNHFLPILRADFQCIETFKYLNSGKFDIPITVLMGKDDNITRDEVLNWQQESSLPIRILEFEGGHFFINNYSLEIAELFAQMINNDSQLHKSNVSCIF